MLCVIKWELNSKYCKAEQFQNAWSFNLDDTLGLSSSCILFFSSYQSRVSLCCCFVLFSFKRKLHIMILLLNFTVDKMVMCILNVPVFIYTVIYTRLLQLQFCKHFFHEETYFSHGQCPEYFFSHHLMYPWDDEMERCSLHAVYMFVYCKTPCHKMNTPKGKDKVLNLNSITAMVEKRFSE